MAALKLTVILVAMVVASFRLQGTVAQTRHVVGDAIGWIVPPGGEVAYTTWASLQRFAVGDTLVFNFTTGRHDVAEVSPAAYGPCTTANPISLITSGPATVPLTTAGTHYYICAFQGHCQNGQKLTINVTASAGTPRSPPTTTTPSPAGSTMPPPPSSAATSFAAVVPVSFLAIALAFFY